MAKTLSDALKKPDNIGEPIPVSAAPRVPPIIPREQPGLTPGSLGPAPSIFTTDYDRVRQWSRPGTSQNRFPPLPTKSNPQLNAASRSVTQSVVAAIPTAPPATAAVTDGLVHGDTIWEHDSAYFELRDDFTTGSNAPNTSPGVGELGWFFQTGGGVTSANYFSTNPPNFGLFEMFQTAATANTFGWLTPENTSGTNPPAFFDCATPFLDTPGWKLTWVFCLRRPMNTSFAGDAAFSLAKSSTYLGLAFRSAASSGAIFTLPRPNLFMGVRYDTDTTAPSIADTTFWLEACFNPMPSASTRNNIQGTNGGAFNTGITPVEGTFYRLDMVYTVSGSVTMTLSGGGQSATTTFTLTKMSMSYIPSGTPANANGVTNTKLTPTAFSTTDGYIPMVWGSVITMSGWTSTNTPLNITTPVYQETNGAALYIPTPAAYTTPSATIPAVTVVGYPALFPFALHGNDSQGTAPNTGRALVVDYFSIVWNKGLTGSTTTDATQSRYW